MTATARILVSRFPGHLTPGALPLLPSAISLGRNRLRPQSWIVYRWFADGEVHHQAPPEFCETLEEALELVPAEGYEIDWDCPEDFAPICYRLAEAG